MQTTKRNEVLELKERQAAMLKRKQKADQLRDSSVASLTGSMSGLGLSNQIQNLISNMDSKTDTSALAKQMEALAAAQVASQSSAPARTEEDYSDKTVIAVNGQVFESLHPMHPKPKDAPFKVPKTTVQFDSDKVKCISILFDDACNIPRTSGH